MIAVVGWLSVSIYVTGSLGNSVCRHCKVELVWIPMVFKFIENIHVCMESAQHKVTEYVYSHVLTCYKMPSDHICALACAHGDDTYHRGSLALAHWDIFEHLHTRMKGAPKC